MMFSSRASSGSTSSGKEEEEDKEIMVEDSLKREAEVDIAVNVVRRVEATVLVEPPGSEDDIVNVEDDDANVADVGDNDGDAEDSEVDNDDADGVAEDGEDTDEREVNEGVGDSDVEAGPAGTEGGKNEVVVWGSVSREKVVDFVLVGVVLKGCRVAVARFDPVSGTVVADSDFSSGIISPEFRMMKGFEGSNLTKSFFLKTFFLRRRRDVMGFTRGEL